jgi:hypothetical protein
MSETSNLEEGGSIFSKVAVAGEDDIPPSIPAIHTFRITPRENKRLKESLFVLLNSDGGERRAIEFVSCKTLNTQSATEFVESVEQTFAFQSDPEDSDRSKKICTYTRILRDIKGLLTDGKWKRNGKGKLLCLTILSLPKATHTY